MRFLIACLILAALFAAVLHSTGELGDFVTAAQNFFRDGVYKTTQTW